MTRSLSFTALLALAAGAGLPACQPATEAQTTAPAADDDMAGMDHGAMTGEDAASTYTDLRFIDGMIHHHQMAVEMAEVIRERGLRPDVRGLAEDVIRTQNVEIDSMRAWRTRWFPDAPPPGPMTADDMAAMGMAMPMDALTSADAPDRPFLDMMLPHHAGAIVMAGEAVAYTERPEVRALARQITRDQAREIGQMQAWLSEGEAPAGATADADATAPGAASGPR